VHSIIWLLSIAILWSKELYF